MLCPESCLLRSKTSLELFMNIRIQRYTQIGQEGFRHSGYTILFSLITTSRMIHVTMSRSFERTPSHAGTSRKSYLARLWVLRQLVVLTRESEMRPLFINREQTINPVQRWCINNANFQLT